MDLDQETQATFNNEESEIKEPSTESNHMETEAETETMETQDHQENPERQPEGQLDSISVLYSKEEMDAFMLNPDNLRSPEMKDAAAALLHEAKFSAREEHTVVVKEHELSKEETLLLDFEKQIVLIGDRIITSAQIRYANLNMIENTKSGYEIVLSYVLENHEIRLLHILCPDNAKILVLSLNGLRRLSYILYKEFMATAQEFRKVLKECSPLFNGSVSGLSLYNLTTKTTEVKDKTMYLCLDRECLMILKSQFQGETPYQMYFWREEKPESVDRVLIMHESKVVSFETKKLKLEIPLYSEGQANDLFQCIRGLVPLPKGSFTDHDRHLRRIRDLETSQERKNMAGNRQAFSDLRQSTAGPWQSSHYTDDKTETNNMRLRSFQGDLRSAVMKFENEDTIALPWVIAEDEITNMLDRGFVPETDILSGGLDPENLDHFLKCTEEVEGQLVKQDYGRALSTLHGMKKIYIECPLIEMKKILTLDDITLLKQLYFHSFT